MTDMPLAGDVEFDTQLKEAMDGVLTKIEAVIDPSERYADLVRRVVGGDPDA